jgi:hypothetical protein
MKFLSIVPCFEGTCKPTWLNRNQIYNRVDGGVSGFFKLVRKPKFFPFYIKYGNEFHGIIHGRVVSSTRLND